jgi:hypothetical protein
LKHASLKVFNADKFKDFGNIMVAGMFIPQAKIKRCQRTAIKNGRGQLKITYVVYLRIDFQLLHVM